MIDQKRIERGGDEERENKEKSDHVIYDLLWSGESSVGGNFYFVCLVVVLVFG